MSVIVPSCVCLSQRYQQQDAKLDSNTTNAVVTETKRYERNAPTVLWPPVTIDTLIVSSQTLRS